MTYKNHPDAPIKIEELEQICKERDLQGLVAVAIARDGTIYTVTYGETERKCRTLGNWSDGMIAASLTRVPFQTEFGYGKGGKPTPISDKQLKEAGSTRESVRKAEEYFLRNRDVE